MCRMNLPYFGGSPEVFPVLPNPFPAHRFHLRARVTRPLELPEFSGSLLRGAFGQVLRDTPLYPVVFEPTSTSPDAAGRYAKIPPPYIIEPPLPGVRKLAIGDFLEFHLVLIGPALDRLPLVLAAWASALELPLGHSQGSAQLLEVRDERESIVFDANHFEPPPRIPGIELKPVPPGLDLVMLEFDFPLSLRHQGKYLGARDLDATHLLRAVVRRAVDVTRLTLGYPIEPDYGTQFRDLDAIHLSKQLKRQVWERYSSRQKKKIMLGGLCGRCRLEGPIDPFWPFLFLGQWLHIGKETTFGLGRYRLVTKGGASS